MLVKDMAETGEWSGLFVFLFFSFFLQTMEACLQEGQSVLLECPTYSGTLAIVSVSSECLKTAKPAMKRDKGCAQLLVSLFSSSPVEVGREGSDGGCCRLVSC